MGRQRGGSGALVPTLALLTTITAVVSSLGAPLVPSIAHQYDVALTTAQWSLTAPLLVAAVATPILGRVAAGRRRRPAILGGLVVVAIGTTLSAGSALSMASAGDRDLLGFEVLVAGRALQGVGMALVPLAIAVARDELAGTRMVRAVALLSVTTVAGAGLGYPLTGLVALVGGLAGAYLLGVLLTLLTLAMAWRGVPASVLAVPARVDWVGALLLSGGVLCLLLGISQGEAWGWRSAAVVGLGATSGVALAAWIAAALWSRHPLVDLRLATRPGLAAPNLVAFVAGIGMYSLLTLTVVLVRADDPGFGLDHSVAVAGLILVPYATASVVGSRWARRAESRLGSRV
ncbi:MFS transporter, partial [Nocardioides stalactiti]|uniref:MFS transporter n=1 Tax=Nocardioides stalactiti TaxID=2755356 RepID=UPI0016028665